MKILSLLLVAFASLAFAGLTNDYQLVWQQDIEDYSNRFGSVTVNAPYWVCLETDPYATTWGRKLNFYDYSTGNPIRLNVNIPEAVGAEWGYISYPYGVSNITFQTQSETLYEEGKTYADRNGYVRDIPFSEQKLVDYNIYTGDLTVIVSAYSHSSQISRSYCQEATPCYKYLVIVDDGRLKMYQGANNGSNPSNGGFYSPLQSYSSSGFLGENYVLNWESSAGSHYQIQTSTDLTNWVDIGEPLTGTGQRMSWANHITNSQSFFRVLEDQ